MSSLHHTRHLGLQHCAGGEGEGEVMERKVEREERERAQDAGKKEVRERAEAEEGRKRANQHQIPVREKSQQNGGKAGKPCT